MIHVDGNDRTHGSGGTKAFEERPIVPDWAVTAGRVVQDPGERPVVIHSQTSGPIAERTFLQRALLFAELAMVAYNDEAEAGRAAELAGFPDITFFDNDGSQAFRFRNEHDCVIAARGTEPNEWNDIQADANAAAVLAETAGKVHRGFKREVDDLWPMLETALLQNDQPLWFCGHSLGGAMATICAGRCFLSHIASNPVELHTFGSPRVGDSRYINYIDLRHFRFVNNNDIVPRVPPVLLGYRHAGTEIYIDRNGKLGRIGSMARRGDRFRGFLRSLRRFKIDHFSDHRLHGYIGALLTAVRQEEQIMAAGGPAVVADDLGAQAQQTTLAQAQRNNLASNQPVKSS